MIAHEFLGLEWRWEDGDAMDFSRRMLVHARCRCGRTTEPTNSEEAARRAYDQHVADERGRALEAARTARLTPAQRRTLANIRDHGDASRGVSGMSAHGGFSQTVAALVRRGFIVIPTTGPYQLSETGEIALQAAEARA
jgi:hypothetical protein